MIRYDVSFVGEESEGNVDREIACAILTDTDGRFLLQQRDDVPGIVYPGMISLFGGHREGDESFLECIVREINEELTYYISPKHFQHLTSVDSSHEAAEIGLARGEIYFSLGIPVENLIVTEGSLLVAGPRDLEKMEWKMTPIARSALRTFASLQPDRVQAD